MANVWSYNFNWNLISQKNELISSCCLLNNKNNNIANKNIPTMLAPKRKKKRYKIFFSKALLNLYLIYFHIYL